MKTTMPALFKQGALISLISALGASSAWANANNSISASGANTLSGWVSTATHAHDVRNATHVGILNPGETVHIAVSLQVRNKPALDALTSQIMAGSAAPLSSAEFINRHAPTQAQAQAVANHLTQNGFYNIKIADNRLLITADGPANSVKNAFKTELHEYNVNGRHAYANLSDVQIPQSLAGTVLAVHGLQTVHQAHTALKRMTATTPMASTSGSIVAINPAQFPAIYGASSLPSATNATIAIITEGSMTQTIADLKTFASGAGYPTPPVTVVTVGAASTDTSGTDEWNLDTQDSLAAAGGTIKSMLLYAAPSMGDADLASAYNQAVSDNKAKVINVSLGQCETDAQSGGFIASGDQIFQAAIAQGQTFSVSAGDSGSYECGGTTSYQSYPAVSPYVMAIGGTTLSTNNGAWSGETAWSCTNSTTCPQSAQGGTGGGVSSTESAPSWQIASGVIGKSTKRGVPDIAFDASPNSGALVLINGVANQIGGTSLAAPLFTGFYSRIQSMNNNSLGFPAQTLYLGAAANPSWFHDVTSGSNGGYSAGTGWDYVTGFGSLIVSNFANSFPVTQLLVNPGFESGSTGWTASANVISTATTNSPAHGGSYDAWLDGYSSAHTDTLSQTITIPSGKTSATLSYWLDVITAETSKTSAIDTLTVTASSSGATSTLATYSNLTATGYKQYSVNLSAYIGKTVTITFTGVQKGTVSTSFILDDTALNVH